MDFPAAPQRGRRATFGAAAVLAAFLLLAPPLFVLAPFVLLTLASRPASVREFFWLVAASAAVVLVLPGFTQGGIELELIRNGSLLLAGVFVVLSLRGRGSATSRGLLALLLTAAALLLWEWRRGVSWPQLEAAFTALLVGGYRALLNPAAAAGAPAPNPELKAWLQPLVDAAPSVARVFPALLALQGLAGLALAWGWHHRVATHPFGRPPAAFRRFRFNDHLIWGAILPLALLLAPVPDLWKALAANLLVLAAGLYATRGLAVVTALLAPAPGPPKLLAALLGLVLFPVALGLWLALGLADTWLDIRGRLTAGATPVSGGG